ncbi:MAG TPA: hypothetical protein VGI44_11445 [Acidimicrobiales bacterium]
MGRTFDPFASSTTWVCQVVAYQRNVDKNLGDQVEGGARSGQR